MFYKLGIIIFFFFSRPRYQLTETESIGRRTRSKLCLNQTAIEDLQLVAPDITPDLDHFSHLANDPHWGELFRLTEQNIEDDIEADPNYNVLDDHEIEKGILSVSSTCVNKQL